MKQKNQVLCHIRHPNLLHYYLDAGLAAGAAAFSSLAGTLFAGFFSSFLISVLAGAVTAGLASALPGVPDGAWAKADTANNDAITSAIDFILFPLG